MQSSLLKRIENKPSIAPLLPTPALPQEPAANGHFSLSIDSNLGKEGVLDTLSFNLIHPSTHTQNFHIKKWEMHGRMAGVAEGGRKERPRLYFGGLFRVGFLSSSFPTFFFLIL